MRNRCGIKKQKKRRKREEISASIFYNVENVFSQLFGGNEFNVNVNLLLATIYIFELLNCCHCSLTKRSKSYITNLQIWYRVVICIKNETEWKLNFSREDNPGSAHLDNNKQITRRSAFGRASTFRAMTNPKIVFARICFAETIGLRSTRRSIHGCEVCCDILIIN